MLNKGDHVKHKLTGRTGEVLRVRYLIQVGQHQYYYDIEEVEKYDPPTTEEVWAALGSVLHEKIVRRGVPLMGREKQIVRIEAETLLEAHGIPITDALSESIQKIVRAIEKQIKEGQNVE